MINEQEKGAFYELDNSGTLGNVGLSLKLFRLRAKIKIKIQHTLKMILGFLPPAIQLKSSRHENVPNFILTQFKLYKENWFSDKIRVNCVKSIFEEFCYHILRKHTADWPFYSALDKLGRRIRG